ncbi:transketolase-like TK C-terminal-containing protein [Actinoallomurus sp. CA-150999]|uniref:transketolase-like TK C-terminal-containing protein n=1 Tax=Actinoallomurus sp. CA-150999 TaxID=3239887 RepID=UPI003D8BBB70
MQDVRDKGVAGVDLAGVDLGVLEEIQRRVLWLAVRIVDAANRERDTGDGVKVGGHQASSASLVTAMTALWFAHLNAEDRVSVKPHASPVFHAIKYLLGDLDRSYLTTLRARGGLQSYPSRTKDPDDVDFSTGSVGLGAAAPLFAAAVRRYVDAHWRGESAAKARFVALLGDAELDEGNVWEAIADPATQGLGNVMWVVDFNRQSLDRVVPGARIAQWRGQFEAAGWHVVEVKYGRRLREAPAAVRGWIDAMPNEHYQALFGLTGAKLRETFLDGAPAEVAAAVADVPDGEFAGLVQDLGGHDLVAMLEAYAQCEAVTDRPSVIFAYTVKGHGLPIAGNPRNHSALLTGEQIDALRGSLRVPGDEWARFDPATPEGILCNQRREALRRTPAPGALGVTVPAATGVRTSRPVSTQDAFGKILVDLSRSEEVAPYLVTTAPDVATSTNLAGFINRTGVFAPAEQRAWSVDPLLKWTEGPTGQHIELGISEMNLFLLLGQLGLAGDLHGQPLLPVGTVYDPFVCRGLDAFIYSVYSGARFVVAGTPSGVTLAPEGGAHQSTITASIGLELPNVTYVEPAYATALDWLLCDALGRIAAGPAETTTAVPAEDGAYYFRLTTRPLDQTPFEQARERLGDAVLRRQVLAGAYLLHRSEVEGPAVQLAASGAVLPEALAAARELEEEGIAAHVVDVTSPDRLYSAWQRTLRQGVRTATTPSEAGALRAAFPVRAPIVTVHDAASHALAWLGSAFGVSCVPLGVDQFGQSGAIGELYELHDLLPGSIVNAALAALALG